jgi:5'(3')-deoxyribonucleotidase
MSKFEDRPIALIDMDGPLADFDAEVVNRLSIRRPDIPILKTRHNFYISDDYPEHSLLLREISDEEGFFESLPLAAYALEGFQRVIDLGYHPRICSKPMRSNPYSKIEKLKWLEREFVPIFGEYVVKEAIITPNKHEQEGVALIDDAPAIPKSEEALYGEHIVFDMEYNQASEQPRLYGWLDDNLAALLEAAGNS